MNSRLDTNLNRFAFNDSIYNLDGDSEIEFLLNGKLMPIFEVFELALELWELGLAPSTMIFIIAHDFEGELLFNEQLFNKKTDFAIGINRLFKDKDTGLLDPLKVKISDLLRLYRKKKFKKALLKIDEILAVDIPITHLFQVQVFQAEIFAELHDSKLSIDSLEKAIEIYNQINTKQSNELIVRRNAFINNPNNIYLDFGLLRFDYPYVLKLKGFIYYISGEFEKSLVNYYESLALRKKSGNKFDIAATYYSIALIYKKLSKFEKALQYYNKSKIEYENLNKQERVIRVVLNMAVLAQKMNKFEKAIKLGNEAYNLSVLLEKHDLIAHSYLILAFTNRYSNKLNKSRFYLYKIIELEDLIDEVLFAIGLYNLVLIDCEFDNFQQVNKNLAKLKEIDENSEFPQIKYMYKLAKTRFTYVSQPEKVREVKSAYSELLNEEQVLPSTKILCVFHMIDMFMNELSSEYDFREKYLTEMFDLIDQFIAYSKQVNVVELHIKLLLLKYRISLLIGDKKSGNYLTQAYNLSHLTVDKNLQEEIRIENLNLENKKVDKPIIKLNITKMVSTEIKYQKYLLELE